MVHDAHVLCRSNSPLVLVVKIVTRHCRRKRLYLSSPSVAQASPGDSQSYRSAAKQGQKNSMDGRAALSSLILSLPMFFVLFPPFR